MDALWQEIEPALINLLIVLIGSVVTAGLASVARWFKAIGLNIELVRRQELDEALARILRGAFARSLTPDQIIDEALAYLKSTMPGTLRDLGVTDAALRNRIGAEVMGSGAKKGEN